MKSGRLFDDQSQFRPGTALTEPVIWIRKLVVLEQREPGVEPVREVEFRPGLNIVATELPEEGETEPVGHNVGKTLLTRLIRYCLGEPQYGKQAVRTAVGREFPQGYVLAEVIAGGELWTVTRPLGQEQRPRSHAHRGMSWQESLSAIDDVSFTAFQNHLESLTVRRFANVILPGQKRMATWRDLFGWLTRDQHCAYRDPLEWRSKWTESGTAELETEDASLIVRLAMDLVDTEEGKLIQRRKNLLDQKREKSDRLRDKSGKLKRAQEFLRNRLQVEEDLLDDGLFAVAASRQLDEEISQLRQQIDQLSITSGLNELADGLSRANKAVWNSEEHIRLRTKDREVEESQLATHRSATDDELLEDLGDLVTGCPLSHPDCGLHTERENEQERKAHRQILIRESTRRIGLLDQELAAQNELLPKLRAERNAIYERHRSLAKVVDEQLRGLRRRFAELDAIRTEADALDSLRKEVDKLAAELEALDGDIKDLRDKQHLLADRNTKKLKQLNESVRAVQRTILGRDADRSIRIGINSLSFTGNDQHPSPGEGMATSATLSLDLACLRAGLEGLGFLPRLLIHDSPRGGDLEPHLYAHLFTFAIELEAAFENPPFQYILATTTHPPKSLLKPPYLRLTLDARDQDRLLLKRWF